MRMMSIMTTLKKRRRWPSRIGVFFIIAFLTIIYIGRDMLLENPFEIERVFNQPSHAVTATDGSLLVIDGGKTRVTRLKDRKVSATIAGGKSEKGFFYAEHMASDGDKIYIADVNYTEGSTKVKAERIIQFSTLGRFEKVLYERTYTDDTPLQYGNIVDMRLHDGILMFLMKNGDALELYGFEDGKASLIRSVDTVEAPYLCSATYDAFADTVYAVAKNGLIYVENEDGLAMIRDLSDTGDVPWKMASDSMGSVYFTNLTDRGVTLMDGQKAFSTDSIVYRLYINENDVLSFTDGESLYQCSPDEHMLSAWASASYDTFYSTARFIVWSLVIVAGLAIVYVAIRLCKWFIRGNHGGQAKYLVIVTVSTLLTSSIVAASILGSSMQTNAQKNEHNLVQMTLSLSRLSNMTIGDDLETIHTLRDYGGPAYTRIHEALDPVCLAASEQDEYLYFALYKNIDGILCGVMDYEDTVGVVYPIGDCPDEYAALLEGNQPYLFESGSDVYGSWTFVVAPVWNGSGEIVGLIEMGSNLDVDMLRIRGQIIDVILSTAVLLFLYILVLIEAIGAVQPLARPQKLLAGRLPELIRPLIFLSFLADSVCTTFLPQLSSKLFQLSGFGFTISVGAALPLSTKLLFVALTALLGGVLIDRIGMRRVLFCGILVQMAGLGVSAIAVASENYMLLLLGLSVQGCGLGAVTLCCNTLPTYFDKERSTRLFSGVNFGRFSGVVVGTSLGAYVVRATGYAMVFVFSAIVLLPSLWFGHQCAPRTIHEKKAVPGALPDGGSLNEKQPKTLVHGFLLNRSVLSFLLFMLFPFMALFYFNDFVFPLFASGEGYSEIAIGQALLFSGAIAILIAPGVVNVFLKFLRAKSANIFIGILFSAGLLLFGLIPTLQSSLITVYILNIAGCVGVVTQSVYFSSIRAFRAYGAGKSMGIHDLFDNLSQAAGPLLFGAALAFGYKAAGLIMGAGSLALFILFALTGESEKINQSSEVDGYEHNA